MFGVMQGLGQAQQVLSKKHMKSQEQRIAELEEQIKEGLGRGFDSGCAQ